MYLSCENAPLRPINTPDVSDLSLIDCLCEGSNFIRYEMGAPHTGVVDYGSCNNRAEVVSSDKTEDQACKVSSCGNEITCGDFNASCSNGTLVSGINLGAGERACACHDGLKRYDADEIKITNSQNANRYDHTYTCQTGKVFNSRDNSRETVLSGVCDNYGGIENVVITNKVDGVVVVNETFASTTGTTTIPTGGIKPVGTSNELDPIKEGGTTFPTRTDGSTSPVSTETNGTTTPTSVEGETSTDKPSSTESGSGTSEAPILEPSEPTQSPPSEADSSSGTSSPTGTTSETSTGTPSTSGAPVVDTRTESGVREGTSDQPASTTVKGGK
jgi:hypothetical protein